MQAIRPALFNIEKGNQCLDFVKSYSGRNTFGSGRVESQVDALDDKGK